MNPILRHAVAAVALCLPFIATAPAADVPADPRARIENAGKAAMDAAQPGPRDIALGTQGRLKLSAGYAFVPQAEASALLAAQGNHTGPGFQGLILGEKIDGFLVLDYRDAGYVKDEDAKDWDAGKLLDNLKEGTEAANEERRKLGVPVFRAFDQVAEAFDGAVIADLHNPGQARDWAIAAVGPAPASPHRRVPHRRVRSARADPQRHTALCHTIQGRT